MFCVSRSPLPSDWPPQPYPLSPACMFCCGLYPMYMDLHFSGILLTLIGMHMLSWFTSKPNVDIGNTIFFRYMNDDGIMYCLKYLRLYPMIIQLIPPMVSSSHIPGCGAFHIMTHICYFYRIRFANWVWQESELLIYFYLTRFPTEKKELKKRIETRSTYSHTPPEIAVIVNKEKDKQCVA